MHIVFNKLQEVSLSTKNVIS